jgi:ADP-ribosylglycohydrolase
MIDRAAAFEGVVLGTAVGDAIGLPREGLSARRASRMFGGAPLRHRLVFGRGMVSDDTEHACMVGQALLASGGDPARFARSLAWRLRWWMLALPAGVGMATARAVGKLWLGFPPDHSGVCSAGNGPAMRAAVIGVWAGSDVARVAQLVRVSTRLTHTEPVAEQGALAVALAAGYGATAGPQAAKVAEFLSLVRPHLTDATLRKGIEIAAACAASSQPPERFLAELGVRGGVSGWISHTVPAALYCWLRWPGDFRTAVEQVVQMGGDADTTGAIVGGLVGATAGPGGIPRDWVDGIIEWPRSVEWMRRLGRRLAIAGVDSVHGGELSPLPLFCPAIVPRNVLFLLVVLLHGLRRLLPPY